MHRQPAVWRLIANQLGERIRDGVYRDGDRLPGEARLATEFGVNRHTVRRALLHLEHLGMINSQQGKGTFVRQRRILYPIQRRQRATSTLRAASLDLVRTLISGDQRPATSTVARALWLTEGAPVWRLDVAGTVGDRAFDRQISFLPVDRFPAFPTLFEEEACGFTRTFERYGISDYVRDRVIVSAEPATIMDAETLRVELGDPMLVTEYVNLFEGAPIQYALTRFVAANTALAVDIPETADAQRRNT